MAWAPDYCTVAQLKAFRRIDDTVDDDQMAVAISAASRSIDFFTNRQFGLLSAAKAWYYTPKYDAYERRWYVDIDDLQTSTGLLVDFDTDDDGSFSTNVTDYILAPRNGVDTGKVWTQMYFSSSGTNPPCFVDSVRVTAKFGWTLVPDAVEKACLLQANRLATRRDAPFGVAGSPNDGSELRLLAKLDPDVMVTLRPFKRVWGAA